MVKMGILQSGTKYRTPAKQWANDENVRSAVTYNAYLHELQNGSLFLARLDPVMFYLELHFLLFREKEH